MRNNQKGHDTPEKSLLAIEISECYREIKYRGGTVLQRWRGSGGNIRLSHLLIDEFLI